MPERVNFTMPELAQDFTSRLHALSNVHTVVFDAGGEAASLSSVIAVTVAPYNGEGLSRIKVHGPDVFVSRTSATTIALCLHELTTNAIKYGALSQKDGSVEVSWLVSDDDPRILSLHWVEAGGPAVSEPTRQGYGTKYVRSALGALFGSKPEIIFERHGLRCHVMGPLERLR